MDMVNYGIWDSAVNRLRDEGLVDDRAEAAAKAARTSSLQVVPVEVRDGLPLMGLHTR